MFDNEQTEGTDKPNFKLDGYLNEAVSPPMDGLNNKTLMSTDMLDQNLRRIK
jgi:hypothetical protein